ncbi:MAG: phospho-N-acetylmuramoyl-pentapeptide-transferase [Lentisphaeria bacterium]|nr:phospho-N-acetylmuramoyl-pentapeptide-transferase [Lentisphaeria bacterium]
MMLYWLSGLSDVFGPFRLFEYVTFRAGGAAFTAFMLTVLLGAGTARVLKSLHAQAADRFEGLIAPELIDKAKNKTPCMGGILIVGAIVLSALLWCAPGRIASVLICSTLLFAAVGFADDYLKVVYRNRDGMPAKWKFLITAAIAGGAVWLLNNSPGVGGMMSQFIVPFFKTPFALGAVICGVIAVFTVLGSCHAVNLTDGKDGLASGCTIFCMITYAILAYLMGHRVFADYLNIPHLMGIQEAVIFAAATGGACLGFLWHNCHPAAMFMGDTGSLALGGIVGMMAVQTRQELLLVLVGGIFVIEALSVILQVTSVKLTGKRIFYCSPFHHHFEHLGWTETQIVVRFWIIAGILALSALATLKLR